MKNIIGRNHQGFLTMLKCFRTHEPIGTNDFPTSVVVNEVEDLHAKQSSPDQTELQVDGCSSNASNLSGAKSADMTVSEGVGQKGSGSSGAGNDSESKAATHPANLSTMPLQTLPAIPPASNLGGAESTDNFLAAAVGQKGSGSSGAGSDDTDKAILSSEPPPNSAVSQPGNSSTQPSQTLPVIPPTAQSVTPPTVEQAHQRAVMRQLSTLHMKELKGQHEAESRGRR